MGAQAAVAVGAETFRCLYVGYGFFSVGLYPHIVVAEHGVGYGDIQ